MGWPSTLWIILNQGQSFTNPNVFYVYKYIRAVTWCCWRDMEMSNTTSQNDINREKIIDKETIIFGCLGTLPSQGLAWKNSSWNFQRVLFLIFDMFLD